jgi:hypothetical protein
VNKILLAIFCFSFPAAATAFNCRQADSISEAVARKDEYVFKGVVKEVERIGEDPEFVAVDFEVATIYLGNPIKRIVVIFDSQYDNRPLNFKPGKRYLISAGSGQMTIKNDSGKPLKLFTTGKHYLGGMCSLRKRDRGRA